MSVTINKRDEYFGLGLYIYFKFNSNVKPSILETKDKDSVCFEMLGATGDSFYLYIKYRSTISHLSRDGSISWTLNFTPNDKATIEECASHGRKVFILDNM